MDDDFFAPPPFDPATALTLLKRQLRELRPLAERGPGFEWKGQPVLQLALADGAIDARLARRPARSPEWVAHALRNAADVRRFVDAVKAQLRRWDDE
jgi:hypothetical protein